MNVTSCGVLKWGDDEVIRDILESLTLTADETVMPHPAFDVVIGCELMYYNTDINLLITTVMKLTNKQGLFIHAHVFRAPSQEQKLIDCLAELGWATLEIPHKEFLTKLELEQHIEWRRVRPLVSGPLSTIQVLAVKYPTWRVFQEEIVYSDDEEDEEVGNINDEVS